MVLYRWSKSFHMGFHVQIPPWPPWDDYHPSSFILVGSSPELEFANFGRTAASGAFEEPGGREQRGRMYGETSPQVGSWLGKSWFEWLKATWGGRCGHAPTETSCRKMIADVYSSRVWNHLVLKMLKDFKGNNRWRTYHRPNFGISYVSFLAFSWVLFPLAPALTLIVRMRHPPLTTRFGAVARESGSGWEIVMWHSCSRRAHLWHAWAWSWPVQGEDFALTGPSGRSGYFCWAGRGGTRRQTPRPTAEDGRPVLRAQHTIVQSVHLLWMGNHFSGLDVGQKSWPV